MQIGNGVEVCSFRDILPDEFVVVFDASFFPRGIRVGEEDLRPELFGNGFMSGELVAVVGGNGPDLTYIREQQEDDRPGEFLCIFPVRQFACEDEVGVPFHQRDDGTLSVLADYRVHFKVTRGRSVPSGRSFVDHRTVGNGFVGS